MRILALFLLLASCVPRPPAPSTGGGIASAGNGSVTFHWVFSRFGADSAQLRAAVVLRGQPGWSEPRDSADARAERAILDSLAAAERHARRPAGLGYAAGRVRIWLVNDYRNAALRFQDESLPWLAGDSILVITVDRVDHVGGPPVVARHALPPLANGRVPQLEMLDAIAGWQRAVQRDPRVAAALR